MAWPMHSIKHPRERPQQQQVFPVLVSKSTKRSEKIRDALVPIGILQLLLQACGREDGDEVQHGSRCLAITNDADVNWLNHKRCGRCSQYQPWNKYSIPPLNLQDPHPKIRKIQGFQVEVLWMLGTQTHEILCCWHLGAVCCFWSVQAEVSIWTKPGMENCLSSSSSTWKNPQNR